MERPIFPGGHEREKHADARRSSRLNEAAMLERIHRSIDFQSLKAQLHSWIFIDPRGSFHEHVIEGLGKLVLDLEPHLTKYDAIVSDEASGRLVGLFLHEILAKQREEQDMAEPKIFFVQGGARLPKESQEAVRAFISRRFSKNEKVLLVTELIQEGTSMRRFVRQFCDEGVDVDIAALSIIKSFDELPLDISRRLYFGTNGLFDSRVGKRFYEGPGWKHSGVTKRTEMGLQDPFLAHPMRDSKAAISDMRAARHDIHVLAGQFLKMIASDKTAENQ